MIHRKKCYSIFLAVALSAGLSACGLEDEEVPIDVEGGGHGVGADHDTGAGGDDTGDDGTPAGEGETRIKADSNVTWVYWSFADGDVVEVSEPDESLDWDLAFRRTQLMTNSGTSGGGAGGAAATGETDWDAVDECPTEGYSEDEMLPLPGPPGSGEFSGNAVLNEWYDYDPASHAVSSKGEVYCVRTASGEVARMSIVNYASGQMTIRWAAPGSD